MGLKLIHLNKCPVLSPAKTLSEARAAELGINRSQCLQHLDWLKKHPEVQSKALQVYELQEDYPVESNPDYQLYSGFISNSDKEKMQQLHQLSPEQLAVSAPIFNDDRLNKLIFLYRARNYPASLTDSEQQQWQQYRTDKIMHGVDQPNLTMEEFSLALENAAHSHADDEQKMNILKALYLYVESL